jgi:predicted RNA polymerase sigma factor
MAEDVAQDALTVLVRRWRTSGPPESPDAYAFAIARRRAGRAVVRHALLAPLGVLRDAGHAGPNAEQAYAGRAELIQGVRHFADCRGSTVRRCCFAPPGN